MEVNYNDIKNNIVNNFLIPYYRFTVVRIKECIISDIKRRSWFPCEYNSQNDILTFNIGNNINIDIHFVFECRTQDTNNNVFYLLNDFN